MRKPILLVAAMVIGDLWAKTVVLPPQWDVWQQQTLDERKRASRQATLQFNYALRLMGLTLESLATLKASGHYDGLIAYAQAAAFAERFSNAAVEIYGEAKSLADNKKFKFSFLEANEFLARAKESAFIRVRDSIVQVPALYYWPGPGTTQTKEKELLGLRSSTVLDYEVSQVGYATYLRPIAATRIATGTDVAEQITREFHGTRDQQRFADSPSRLWLDLKNAAVHLDNEGRLSLLELSPREAVAAINELIPPRGMGRLDAVCEALATEGP